MSLRRYEFCAGASDDGITLKSFLRQRCGLSARSLTVIKYNGGSITRSGCELRSHDIVHKNDCIIVELPQEQCTVQAVRGCPDILYEDDRLLIVNKPAVMPVHPTKVHQLDTLANIVAFYQQSRGESYTFRALNRLDKDTSGCVIIAKDRIAYSLVLPTVRKTYIAVCEGIIEAEGTVDAPISLAPDSKIRRCVSAGGAHAVTHYLPLSWGEGHTLCRIRLETGRTHQIRCHMSYIGHPLAGDDLYGGSLRSIGRQALHCQSVELLHPVTREKQSFSAAIPEDLDVVMTKLCQ